MTARLLGALLLIMAGFGGGAALAAERRACWRTIHTFAALLDFLQAGIRYQALPCGQLLAQAAADERFAALGLAACADFAAVPVPPALGPALAGEARQTLDALSAAPQQRACALLARLLAECRVAAEQADRAAAEAEHLYPRLGLCAGLLAVLFLL